MPSSDFQKIVRDLANISEKLEIKSVGDELIFHVLDNMQKLKSMNETRFYAICSKIS